MTTRTTDRFTLRKYGPHGMSSMCAHEWLNIWEGAVRSGKTVCSLVAFLSHIATSPATVFSMSGKTARSCVKNCILGDSGLIAMVPGSEYVISRNEVRLPMSFGGKTIYIYGGGQEGDDEDIMGLTSGGHYFDEISKHTIRFINAALSRSVSYGRKAANFGTLNADDPESPIYSEFIDRYRNYSPVQRNSMGGFSYWFFTLQDNPILTKDDIKRISAQYHGYEYDRFILSKRVRPEGLVYSRIPLLERPCIVHIDPRTVDLRFASADWGANHPTVFHIGGDFNERSSFVPDKWGRRPRAIVREFVCSRPGMTAGEAVSEYMATCRSWGLDPCMIPVAVDPSALVLKNELISRGVPIRDADNDVRNGIDYCKDQLYSGACYISDQCTKLISEFSLYTYDSKHLGELVIKINDDACDSMRYLLYTWRDQDGPLYLFC